MIFFLLVFKAKPFYNNVWLCSYIHNSDVEYELVKAKLWFTKGEITLL